MSKIRLVAFDLDGTLLTSDKSITPYTEKVISELTGRGILVVPTTGRPISGVPEELTGRPDIRYVISANGARVIDLTAGRTIMEYLLPLDTARRSLEILEDYDTIIELYYDGLGFVQADQRQRIWDFYEDEAIIKYFLSTRNVVPDLNAKFRQENRAVDKLQGMFRTLPEREEAKRRLGELPGVKLTSALLTNIEINRSDVNKGNVLMRFAADRGIAPDEVMAFGDGDNDTEMLELAGIGVAMANGVPEVTEAADYVTASNDNEGVARAIDKFILNN